MAHEEPAPPASVKRLFELAEKNQTDLLVASRTMNEVSPFLITVSTGTLLSVTKVAPQPLYSTVVRKPGLGRDLDLTLFTGNNLIHVKNYAPLFFRPQVHKIRDWYRRYEARLRNLRKTNWNDFAKKVQSKVSKT